MILLIAIYTYYTFRFFSMKEEEDRNFACGRQLVCLFMLHFLANLVIILHTKSEALMLFYGVQVLFFVCYIFMSRVFYKRISRLLLNNVCMLLCTGLIILTRLNPDRAMRQFAIVAISAVLTWIIPFIVDRVWQLVKLPWLYGILGISLLTVVCLIGNTSYGAQLSLTVYGVSIQPSEFVKILFVFFVAAMFYRGTDFKHVVITTAAAAVHVLILVLSKDLGSALIFFITYLMMLFVATSNWFYLGCGVAGGAGASVVAYRLFAHVRRRVEAWRDPWADIDDKGYQVTGAFRHGNWWMVWHGALSGCSGKNPGCGERFYLCSNFRRTGSTLCNLSVDDLPWMFYPVYEHCNENAGHVL